MSRAALGIAFAGLVAAACGAALTSADRASLSAEAVEIQACETRGLACKADGGSGCYGVYAGCMAEAGLGGDL